MTYEKELEFAKSLALEAGSMTRAYFLDGVSKDWKSDGTPLTLADVAVNKLVIERVQDNFPSDNVLGEEESLDTGGERTWVCDPIDGTLPFSHGIPTSTFTISLVEDGVPTVAVIYDPYQNRLWSAVKGGGACLNDAEVHVNQNVIENSYINVDFLNKNGHKNIATVGSIVDSLQARNCMVSTMWSSVYAAGLVAEGQATAVICGSPHAHDCAAAKLIVEEAGGKVTDIYGDDQRYDGPTKGFIASNGIVHEELLKLVQEMS